MNPKQDSINFHIQVQQQNSQQFTKKGGLTTGQGGEWANMPQAGSSINVFYFKDLDIDVAQHPPKVQIDHSEDGTQCMAGIDEFRFNSLNIPEPLGKLEVCECADQGAYRLDQVATECTGGTEGEAYEITSKH
jgi:hypothetical protein